ncbi:MAG: exodeoxyribonuclease VII large subunit [Verrucomicrobiota bacterium]
MDLFSDIPPKESKALSVTQLVRKMKRAIESGVGKLWIEGEVSNLKKQASGHWYFSLKDEGSQIQCAIFNALRKEGSEALEDGLKVKIFADATIYEPRGQLQLIVEKVETSGLGNLQAKFEALKRKLLAEGLFDQGRKVTLPVFPRIIGIVTSPTGAAIQDILNILKRRAPWVQPVLFPVRVQGKGVEHEIASAIRKLNQPEFYGYPRCDLLIVGRGGGSLEDLWAFNEEVVARAIAASTIPIISAVGHEIDFTIADFVADMRAPTPSAAAELAVPDAAELKSLLNNAKKRITRSLSHALREPTQRIDQLRESLLIIAESSLLNRKQDYRELLLKHENLHPRRILERRMEKTVELQRALTQLTQRQLSDRSLKLENLQSLMRTLGPDSAFKRGFSITMTEDGKIIRSSKNTEPGMRLRTKLIDGEISSTIP